MAVLDTIWSGVASSQPGRRKDSVVPISAKKPGLQFKFARQFIANQMFSDGEFSSSPRSIGVKNEVA